MTAPERPDDCIFCKIVDGDIPAEIVHADETTRGLPRPQPAGPHARAGDPAQPLRERRRAGPPRAGLGGRHGQRRVRGRRRRRASTRATGSSSTPAPAPARPSSTPTCTCSAAGPLELAARMSARLKAALGAAAAVVLLTAGLSAPASTGRGRRADAPRREPRAGDRRVRDAAPRHDASRRAEAGQGRPAPQGRAPRDAGDAGGVHPVRAVRHRHRRLPLLPARPRARRATSG